jgi:hypothetical protein
MTTSTSSAAGSGLPETTDNSHRLEYALVDLRNQARVIRIVAEETIFPRDDLYELDIKRRCPAFEQYVVRVMTEDQAEALNFVVLRMIQMAEEIQALFLGTPAEPKQVRS